MSIRRYIGWPPKEKQAVALIGFGFISLLLIFGCKKQSHETSEEKFSKTGAGIKRTKEKLTDASDGITSNKCSIDEFYNRLTEKLVIGDRHPKLMKRNVNSLEFRIRVLDNEPIQPCIDFVESCFNEVNGSCANEFKVVIPSLVLAGYLEFNILDLDKSKK